MVDFGKVIGTRVKELRERSGISQERLAVLLGVGRSTVSQIEGGSRKLSAEEIVTLARILNVSAPVLLGTEKEPKVIIREVKTERSEKATLRINVPQKNLTKFKEVLLYILNEVGSKPNIGETVIYKLLYFMDFNFYEKYEEQLIGASYIKNHYGPTPTEFKKVLDAMIAKEEVVKVESKYFDYPQTKYLPLRVPDLSKLGAHEIAVIDDVLCKLSDMNAAQMSDYSHGDVPWLTTEDGKVIEYESVFYRTPPYSVREYSEDLQ
jgi:transcriptional regulator with XRE-family HTH domain